MAWFRASSSAAKFAVRKTLSYGHSYVRRTHIIRVYLEELQRSWEADPSSVDESWDQFFRNFVGDAPKHPGVSGQTIQESMKLLLLVRAYQVNGHLKAKLDPLNLEHRVVPEVLSPEFYGFTEADLDREFFIGVWKLSGFLSENRPVNTLRSILDRLEQTYCGSMGYEYVHIFDREKCNWLTDKIETPTLVEYSKDRCKVMLDRLVWSTQFENFLANKWSTAKRFGLEGCEALIPGMKEMIDRSAELGVESIVMGMAHRGRLNVLGNVLRKPLHQIFSEFSSGRKPIPEDALYVGTGDVKYHLATSFDRPTISGKRIHPSLVANPSHLEAVDPVVVGKTRAKQFYSDDVERTKNLGTLIHAFTTDPKSGRSSEYCTDVAKALNVPIFHVNGDDLEAVVRVSELAAEWRQTFHSDVVIDIVCYRRFGHNEIDEPSFTQPTMNKVIRSHPPVLEKYKRKLLESGILSTEDIEEIQKRVKADILRSVGNAISTLPKNLNAHKVVKKIYEQRLQMVETGQGVDWAFAEALAFGTLLEEGIHVRISGQDVERGTFSHRHAVIVDQETEEKYYPLKHVMEKQKAEMFTISSRSALSQNLVFLDLSWAIRWKIQIHWCFGKLSLVIFANEAQIIFDQFLSSGEAKWLRQTGLVALLPHGYDGQGPEHSSARLERFLQAIYPEYFIFFILAVFLHWTLTLIALYIIFLICKTCDVQMCDDNPHEIATDPTKQIQECNWQVVNVTTPANYFHVLRRQVHREFRKPLIVMSPKNLLRHKDCKSYLSELDDLHQTSFKRLLEDKNYQSDLEKGVRRLVLCSGKVYYELDDERKKHNSTDIAICRVEQICPFPYDLIQQELQRFPNAEIVWCQEEPMNMGAFNYIAPRLCTSMKALRRGNMESIKYVGRPPSAATATGFYQVHVKEQSELVQKALQPEPIHFPW
uniref:2-oxoglutarate dehydrogenase, mitochondrial n=1 Tax=Chenopodium quinoa TaxID=63459 RepID=A0A803NDP7_CHEQI